MASGAKQITKILAQALKNRVANVGFQRANVGKLCGVRAYSITAKTLQAHDEADKVNYKGQGTVALKEKANFERLNDECSWWDENGMLKELHSMNRLRIPLIRDGLLNNGQISEVNTPYPLEGIRVLDVGCGGGILSEPLGRLGAKVTGIDVVEENVNIATKHLPKELTSKVSYQYTSIEKFSENNAAESFDAVVMSEVIEHVENPDVFLKFAASMVKPGGSLFITTISRTIASWLGAIVAWELLFRQLPSGTHNWDKFLTPEEIISLLYNNGCITRLVHGMGYNPVINSWEWITTTDINYAIHAVKKED